MRFSPIVELRQYVLRPGKRDVLVDLFEEQFIETQEEVGMSVIGIFYDLDDENRFVWLRGFADMESRARGLADFYYGPVWKQHRDVANSTMIDSDDVLLLRPARADSAFALSGAQPSPDAPGGTDRGLIEATILSFERPPDAEALALVDRTIAPLLIAAGASMLGVFVTEYSENTFAGLPIREGEHVIVWFAGYPDRTSYEAASGARREIASTAADAPRLIAAPHALRLVPTRRSQLAVTMPVT